MRIFNKRDSKSRKKDWRSPYRGSKKFDASCRNHGSCSYCLSNRTHKHKRQIQQLEE